MMLARRSRLVPRRSAAATVSSVDWPLTCSTRANVRTRSDRSSNVITAQSSRESGVSRPCRPDFLLCRVFVRCLQSFRLMSCRSGSCLYEGQQVGIDLVLVGRAHAMWRARIDLQPGVLHDLG